jgi:hypothetical protein
VSFFKQNWLKQFAALEYQSKSHSLNKAVIAAYYNVAKYGFTAYSNQIVVKQSRRTVAFVLNKYQKSDPEVVFGVDVGLSEQPIYPKKNKEVCYALPELFDGTCKETNRGVKFSARSEVKIVDYKKDLQLDLIYGDWKQMKESDPKVYLMTFNPARYYRSYELADNGYNIYQKLILIKDKPYAVINFALQGEYAYELSFLSRFKDKELKLINDQNDCIIIHCLHDLYQRGIMYVNLGTDAGIKGLKFFKRKLPHFEQIVYST